MLTGVEATIANDGIIQMADMHVGETRELINGLTHYNWAYTVKRFFWGAAVIATSTRSGQQRYIYEWVMS
jgi:hypothetical protein